MTEVFAARIGIEANAVCLAAQRATTREARRLRDAADVYREAGNASDIEALVASDEAFHHTLVMLAGNDFIARLYNLAVPRLHQHRLVSLALPGAAERSHGKHMAITDAVAAGDASEAHRQVSARISIIRTVVNSAARVGKLSQGPHEWAHTLRRACTTAWRRPLCGGIKADSATACVLQTLPQTRTFSENGSATGVSATNLGIRLPPRRPLLTCNTHLISNGSDLAG